MSTLIWIGIVIGLLIGLFLGDLVLKVLGSLFGGHKKKARKKMIGRK